MKKRRPSGSTSDDEVDNTHHYVVHAASAPDEGSDGSNNQLKPAAPQLDSKQRPKAVKSTPSSTAGWAPDAIRTVPSEKELVALRRSAKEMARESAVNSHGTRYRSRLRNPWSTSWLMLATLASSLATMFAVWRSFTTRQLDPKGGSMSYMASAFVKFPEFDTEHTPFATKYSLYLYRELGIDEDPKVKGAPVLFIPGNAGSYKQVRSLASEAANFFQHNLRQDPSALASGKRPLDFFTVDFNEDITAFHGQTLVDQAEYLNDAIAFILSLYHDDARSLRDAHLPDPTSVILVGHSMGGVVARTMLTMHNYQANSVNTIITLSAPHARPPVSFDSKIVQTYKTINDYWRRAHSKEWGTDNPLWHVTVISIAGGGLDTVVPSDYASVASLMPETHGFTVFTSSIPGVWTGMDHLAITWCDEFRKVVTRALYDILDVDRSSQTKIRGERMRLFKKHFLTGLEGVTQKTLPHETPKTLLTLEDSSNSVLSQGERLVLRKLGHSGKKEAYLLPIPPQGGPEGRKFTLLTDQDIDSSGENGHLQVLFCSVFPLQAGHSAALFSMNVDLSEGGPGSTRLACKNAASDTLILPASYATSRFPFDKTGPFRYLQYELGDLSELQFVAVVDKAVEPTDGWVVAEFSTGSESIIRSPMSARQLIAGAGMHLKLPAERPLMVDVKLSALASSLLAYHFSVSEQECGDDGQLFTPFVRQYILDVYESKFFVNVNEADINLHGVAPYMPPALRGKDHVDGLSFQIWSDPTCDSSVQIIVKLDLLGSLGKLWMRYRTMFATFPLLVVALVLRKQFKTYDESGIFMSFSEGLSQCLRTSIPILLLSLTFLSTYLARASEGGVQTPPHWFSNWRSNATESVGDYTKNDLLIGSPDTFFWFLLPVFGVIAVGLCIAVNYALLSVQYVFTAAYSRMRFPTPQSEDGRRTPASFAVTSTGQRIITTSVLLALVSTVIPYQFAYMVLCIVGIATSVRALRVAWETKSDANYNFYNYSHSILSLMLWILPINMPVLVVWIRNLAVQWLTPFSSHHNILSVMPYILVIETLSTGRMIPRVTTRIRYITNVFLLVVALYAALYGVSYAYLLHQVVNIFCAWLVVIHWSTSSFSFSRLNRLLDGATEPEGDVKKRP